VRHSLSRWFILLTFKVRISKLCRARVLFSVAILAPVLLEFVRCKMSFRLMTMRFGAFCYAL